MCQENQWEFLEGWLGCSARVVGEETGDYEIRCYQV